MSNFHSKHRVYSGNQFQCPIIDCRSAFTKKTHLEEHIRLHENNLFLCVFCPFKTAQAKELSSHYRRHYRIFDYKCNLCEKLFVRAHELHSHRENFHQMGEVFKCHLCDYVGTRMKLAIHFGAKHKMSCRWNKVTKSYDTFEK